MNMHAKEALAPDSECRDGADGSASASRSRLRDKAGESVPNWSRAISIFVSISAVVWLCKLFTLYRLEEPWSSYHFVYVAGAAVVGSVRDILVVAGLCLLYGWALHGLRRRPIARLLATSGLLLLAGFTVLLNLINAELVPRLGVRLTAAIIRYSDVLNSYHGRNALWSWVSPAGLELAAACLLVIIVTYFAAQLAIRRFGVRAAIIVVSVGLLPGTVLAFSGPLTRLTESGTIAFVSSLRHFQGTEFGSGARADPPFVLTRTEAGLPPLRVKNAVLIVLESAAAQYLDSYGGRFSITPNLARLGGDSIVVRNAYAHTVSSTMTFAALVGARYPPIGRGTLLPTSDQTLLPSVLAQHGFQTGVFHSSDLRFGSVDSWARSFGIARDYRDRRCSKPLFKNPAWLGNEDRCTFADLTRWIDERGNAPFFAMLWTFQAHYPYMAKPLPDLELDPRQVPTRRGRRDIARYLAAISEADRLIGELVRHLRKVGLYDDTLIIVTGDHGQAFGGHGNYASGTLLYEESVRVPLILINPQLDGSRDFARLTGHLDIAPTIADAVGVPVPRSWEGRSLFADSRERPIYFSNLMSDVVVGYRLGDRKVIANLVQGSLEVFDVNSDPQERRNLAGTLPAREVARQRDWLATWATQASRRDRQ